MNLNDNEQYRQQITAICCAAVGAWKEGDSIHPDYVTPALHEVTKLYAQLTTARQHIAELEAANTRLTKGVEDAIKHSETGAAMNSDLIARCRKLEAEKAALEADARRYRWLRSQLDDDKDYKLMERKKGCAYGMKQFYRLDAAIDAQLAAERGKGVEG